ncbi:MAG: HlyD family type I secretion periplasmic adaptor subunit [Rhodospirillaceae bacterium]|nr:HlyD family type I secretion periplasmic adaptor subunit [Rhodospirillaceae bacterium]
MNMKTFYDKVRVFVAEFLNRGDAPGDAPNIRGASILGGAITGLFIFMFIVWGGLAPIASASIATGVLVVEGKTRTIQHLEGGIVGEILVRDGDKIAAGEVLVRLDDTKARATYDLLSKRRLNASALMARLQAEHNNASEVSFPASLANSTDPDLMAMVDGQNALFASRRANLTNQVAILDGRIAEYQSEIVGLQGRIGADQQQHALTREQIGDVRALLKEGLARKPRLLELEVKASEIDSRLRHSKSQITRNQQRIQGVNASISETRTKQASQVADALRNAEAELLDMDERLRAAEDVLARTAIMAPVSGVVTNLRVNTNGGVIAPGEPVVDIVPEDERLIVEARVRPDDIDIVRPGLAAHVRFTALNQRNTQPAPGIVRTISADRLVEPNTGESYFLATVELDETKGTVPEELLYPGMSAEVMIETGERSALAYLFEPLTNSMNRAFREN